jgi:hypothetical protein
MALPDVSMDIYGELHICLAGRWGWRSAARARLTRRHRKRRVSALLQRRLRVPAPARRGARGAGKSPVRHTQRIER